MVRGLAIVVLMCGIAGSSPADESDDALARRLIRVVRDPRLKLGARIEAARTIGKLGPKAAAAAPELAAELARLRGAELEPLQEAVIDALGQLGSPARDALPTIARAAGRTIDIDQAIKRATDTILAASDSQDITSLTRQLASLDPSVRLRGVKALGLLGPAAKFAIPDLITVLGDSDPDVRRAAVVALNLIQPNARPTVQVARSIALDLNDPDAAVRLLAVRSLGRLGGAALPAVDAIEPLLNDPDPDVRKAAAAALAQIGAQ